MTQKRRDAELLLGSRILDSDQKQIQRANKQFIAVGLDTQRVAKIISKELKLEDLSEVELCALYVSYLNTGLLPAEYFFDEAIIKKADVFTGGKYFEEFLESEESHSNMLSPKSVMDFIRIYESKLSKHIIEMSAEELVTLVESMDYLVVDGIKEAISIMRAYAQWGKEKGYFDDIINLSSLSFNDISMLPTLKRNLIQSPQKLADLIRLESSWYESGQLNVLLVFAWLGIQYKDVCEIKDDDVDLETGAIRKFNIENIAEPLLQILRDYKQELLTVDTSRFDIRGDTFIKIVTNKSSNSKITVRYLIYSMDSFRKRIIAHGRDIAVSTSTLKLSGQLYQLYEYTGQGVPSETDIIRVFGLNRKMQNLYYRINCYKTIYSEYLQFLNG